MITWGPSQIVTDGLLLHLDAANQKSYSGSGTLWRDLTGRRNNGTLVNGPTFSGGTIVFNGTTQNISIDTEIALDGSWTINYWQNVDITEDMFSIPSLLQISGSSGASSPGSMFVQFSTFTSIGDTVFDSDNNIYVGGQFGGYDGIVRDTLVKINEDGSPNSLFNSGRSIVNGGVVNVNKMHLLQDGRLASVGTNWGTGGVSFLDSINGTLSPNQLSLTPGGSISSSFIDEPTNSMWVLDSWGTSYQGQNINGKIWKIDLTTFTINSTFDSSTGFKSAVGKVTVSTTEGVNDGIVLQDGNLLCVGTFMEYKGVPTSRIVKINSTTAALDTSFVYGSGFNSTTSKAVQLNNGTIVIVGAFTSYNGTSRSRIIGLNPDGSINSSFNVGSGFNSTVSSIVYDSINDKLFCVGLFTSYQGVSANRVIKLNSDGSRDTSFNYGAGFNLTTSRCSLDSLGRLVVTSDAPTLTYQGQTIPRRICRINPDGSLDTTFSSLGFVPDRFRVDGIPRLVDNSAPFQIGFFGINSNREIINMPNGAMTHNGFKHYAITFNSSNNQMLAYRDGALVRTMNLAARMPLRCKTVFSYGNLGNFAVYNRALSASEVSQNYNSTKSRFGV